MKREKLTAIPKRKEQPKIYTETTLPASTKKGTELWQMVARRVGRPYRFETGQAFFTAACEYFQWCYDNPIVEIDYKGKDATPVEMIKPRPFAIRDMCLFLGINEDYLSQLKKTLDKRIEEKDEEEAKEFSRLLAYVYEICYSQKSNLAIVGIYKDGIVSRILGLAERTESIVKTQELPKFVMIDDMGNKIEGIE
jgi:hypothetical protein